MAGWRPKNAEGKVLEGGLWVPEEMVAKEEDSNTPSLSSSGRPRGVDWTPGELMRGEAAVRRQERASGQQERIKQQAKKAQATKPDEASGRSGELQGKVDGILGMLQGGLGGLVQQGKGGVPGAAQSPQLQASSNAADQNYNMLSNILKPHPDQARVAPKRDLSAEADKILADQEGYYSAVGKKADEDRKQREKKDPMAYLGVLQGLLGKK